MQTLFSDMNPLSLSNGTHTAAKSCASEPPMDGSAVCACTRETFGCSIHPTMRDEWIASMQASLVRMCQLLEIEPGSATTQEAAFIEKCSESLALFDHTSCSWKTSQRSFLEDWEPFSETWPRAGMIVAGRAYRHRQSVPPTFVIGGGVLRHIPTPSASDYRGGIRRMNGKRYWNLRDWYQWATDHLPGPHTPHTQEPRFWEWAMGFPDGLTASRDWVMRKSRSKPQSHGDSWEAHEHRP